MRVLSERLEPQLALLEPEYRRHHLRADALQAQVFALVIVVANLIFVPVDMDLFRARPDVLAFTMGLRAAGVLSSLGFVALVQRVTHPASYDRLVLAYMVLLGVLQGLSAATRPADYYGSFVFDLNLVLCCYLVVPTTLPKRVAGASAATLVSLLTLFLVREPSLLYGTSVPIALVGAHVIGLIGSTRSFTYRREAYRAIHEAQQLNERLKVLAELDALTGVLNRRKFTELGNEEFERYRRYGRAFSLVVADVDFFKRVNDRHGHATGDAVLVRVAQAMGAAKREPDALGRLGGEEFALLLPETQRAAAVAVAERMRDLVETATIRTLHGSVAVTLSAGVVEIVPADTSFEDAVHRADQLLYRAKELGRNRVEA